LSTLKKALIGVLVVIGIGAALFGYVFLTAFGGNKPVEDGATYERATVIEDISYVSMYLVDAGNGKFVLVDGGVDQKYEATKTVLAEHDATAQDLLAVLLTHGHGDHIGAAYGLTDVPLYAHEDEVALVQGEAAPDNPFGKNEPGLKVDHTFKHGDILEFGEARFEVFHAPGHTQGNSAFLVGGVLLLGDTAQVTTDDQLHSPPWFFSDDPEQAIATIRGLAKQFESRPEKPNTIVGSHSGSTSNVDALLKYDGD